MSNFHLHETIKNHVLIITYESTKRIKQHLKNIYLIDRYYPIFFHFQEIQQKRE